MALTSRDLNREPTVNKPEIPCTFVKDELGRLSVRVEDKYCIKTPKEENDEILRNKDEAMNTTLEEPTRKRGRPRKN